MLTCRATAPPPRCTKPFAKRIKLPLALAASVGVAKNSPDVREYRTNPHTSISIKGAQSVNQIQRSPRQYTARGSSKQQTQRAPNIKVRNVVAVPKNIRVGSAITAGTS